MGLRKVSTFQSKGEDDSHLLGVLKNTLITADCWKTGEKKEGYEPVIK